ncbi:hypothetical protein [Microbulbifer sp.]|uniref:hypothetical protein n=1 Tax=Microbulbifer sp. TaxID=1908541 RepID=UPI00258F3E4C|nr:hypothetical protein [Microbulbifer sp.]
MNIQGLLQVIRDQLHTSLDKVIGFANTNYSYEEWINWEIFHALSRKNFTCTPKPSYKLYGQPINNRYQADIYAKSQNSGDEFIIEVALVGVSTQDKWLKKIERDREKLTSFMPRSNKLTKFQVLVLVADYENVLSEWEYWLSRLGFWAANPPLTEICSSSPGEIVVCGWQVTT